MEHIGNGIHCSRRSDIEVDGKRNEREIEIISVQFREHEGEVKIREDWPEDGIEWDVCPAEWESIESDVQDWAGL